MPGRTQTDTNIVPLYAVAPEVFQTGLNSQVLFTVLNANPNSTQRIQPGDTFIFSVNVSGGSIASLGTVTVNAAGFSSANLLATLSADGKQVTLTYSGPAALFGPGESFSVSVNLILSQVTAGFVTLQVPANGYDRPQSFAASLSGVGFGTSGTTP